MVKSTGQGVSRGWRTMSRSLALAAVDRCLSVRDSSDEFGPTRQLICDPRLDWLQVVSWANKHLVAPALWTNLSRPAFCELLPQDVRDYLAFLHARNAARNARIRLQCLEIGSNLARAGLRAGLLKGAAWLFDGNSLAASDRMMRDIDLAVAPQEYEPAVRALAASGYREARGIHIEVGHFHHPPMVCEAGEASVEIHRDLANRIEFLSSQEVIASAREVAPGLLLPGPQHRIVHNVIHAQTLNGDFIGGVFDLRDGLDLARLIAHSGPEFDWTGLALKATDRGYFRHLSGAIHAAHRTLRSPLPPPFADHLWGQLHAWRCVQQRRWPRISKVLETMGLLARALAWQRDAYALGLKTRRSLRAQILVNRRRWQRAKAALRRILIEERFSEVDKSRYRGIFINLDRSVDRRTRLEAQLRKFNLEERYSRFSAFDGYASAEVPGSITAGEHACFRSHYTALEGASSKGVTIHIMEDDVELSPQLEQIICSLDEGGALDNFDIVFTDMAVDLDLELLRNYKKLFDTYWRRRPRKLSVIGINNQYRWGSESYLVPSKAVSKVLSVLHGGLEAGPQLPVDVFLRQEAHAGRLRLGCIFPFVTSIQFDEVGRSTLGHAQEHLDLREVFHLLRYFFFVGRDPKSLQSFVLEKLRVHDNDKYHRRIANVLGLLGSSSES
jgi:GR25 family glycosyltransferase involved in LPS biosynthesis